MNDSKNTYEPLDHPEPREASPYAPEYSNIYNPQGQPGRNPEQQRTTGNYYPYGSAPSAPPPPYPYPPYPPQGAQGGRNRQPYEASRYDSYQYSPNYGWEQPQPRDKKREDPYTWNPEEYSRFDTPTKRKSSRKKGHGFVIFAVCFLLTLSAGLVAVTAISMLGLGAAEHIPAVASRDNTAPEAPSEASHSGASVQLNLASKPAVSEAPVPGSKLTIPQVAEKVTPSVVSVVKYVNSQFMEPVGLGSGIIFTEDGYIVTNAHVVSGGTDFKVHLYNGDPYDAKIIGMDVATDLAVLKLDIDGMNVTLAPAQFGDSTELVVGETVIAIGNPVNLNFAGSVTQGIVSALNRQVDTTRYSINYIQTDAAINPGNSGGALVNEYGQVIGINVAKIGAAGYEGMGFAIPLSDARPIIEDLLAYSRVTGRVKLGIAGQTVDEYDAKRYDWKPGIMIQSIDTNSDLIGKDIQKGDIITHINGERVYKVTDIHAQLDGLKVGDTIEMTIYRKINTTKSTEFTVMVALVEDLGQ